MDRKGGGAQPGKRGEEGESDSQAKHQARRQVGEETQKVCDSSANHEARRSGQRRRKEVGQSGEALGTPPAGREGERGKEKDRREGRYGIGTGKKR